MAQLGGWCRGLFLSTFSVTRIAQDPVPGLLQEDPRRSREHHPEPHSKPVIWGRILACLSVLIILSISSQSVVCREMGEVSLVEPLRKMT